MVGGSNAPLRGTKGQVFEGGTRVPAMVSSKNYIPKFRKGKRNNGLVYFFDKNMALSISTLIITILLIFPDFINLFLFQELKENKDVS